MAHTPQRLPTVPRTAPRTGSKLPDGFPTGSNGCQRGAHECTRVNRGARVLQETSGTHAPHCSQWQSPGLNGHRRGAHEARVHDVQSELPHQSPAAQLHTRVPGGGRWCCRALPCLPRRQCYQSAEGEGAFFWAATPPAPVRSWVRYRQCH